MKILNRELIRFFPREAVKFAKQYFKGKKINACEVGVYFGEHARSMNKELNIKNLYLIDPYIEYGDEKTQEHLNKAKETAHRTNRKGNEVWIENISYETTLNLLPLDFLYIDANHEYDAVKRDLQIYYPFVKKGGIIAGHDIQYKGVSDAVIEFCLDNNMDLHIGDRRDFWFIKK